MMEGTPVERGTTTLRHEKPLGALNSLKLNFSTQHLTPYRSKNRGKFTMRGTCGASSNRILTVLGPVHNVDFDCLERV